MKRLRAFFSVLEHTAPGFLSFEVEKSDDFDGFCEKQLLERDSENSTKIIGG